MDRRNSRKFSYELPPKSGKVLYPTLLFFRTLVTTTRLLGLPDCVKRTHSCGYQQSRATAPSYKTASYSGVLSTQIPGSGGIADLFYLGPRCICLSEEVSRYQIDRGCSDSRSILCFRLRNQTWMQPYHLILRIRVVFCCTKNGPEYKAVLRV